MLPAAVIENKSTYLPIGECLLSYGIVESQGWNVPPRTPSPTACLMGNIHQYFPLNHVAHHQVCSVSLLPFSKIVRKSKRVEAIEATEIWKSLFLLFWNLRSRLWCIIYNNTWFLEYLQNHHFDSPIVISSKGGKYYQKKNQFIVLIAYCICDSLDCETVDGRKSLRESSDLKVFALTIGHPVPPLLYRYIPNYPASYLQLHNPM